MFRNVRICLGGSKITARGNDDWCPESAPITGLLEENTTAMQTSEATGTSLKNMAPEVSKRDEAGKKLRDINVTQDELAKFSKALKDEGFRKLLGEYVDEIRDPENRKRYEAEIALLEQERGNDITWIHPQPGHVLKLYTEAGGKAFINVCSNDNVGAPSCARSTGQQQRGLNWSIPYAQSRPREDRDKSGAGCTVYDVVFHPDTLYMAARNPQMSRLVEQTAVQAVNDTFSARLKTDKIARPKLQYKGVPQASIVRRRREGAGDGDDTPLPEAVVEQLRRQAAEMTLDASASSSTSSSTPTSVPSTVTSTSSARPSPAPAPAADESRVETPEYSVVYRDCVDMQQFAVGCGGAPARPQALVLRIQLPRLTSAAGLDLDVGRQSVTLRSVAGRPGPRYHLDAVLPLPVLDSAGSATFDRAARCLVVTLPVAPVTSGAAPAPATVSATGPADCVQDSGIDSDGAKNESDDGGSATDGDGDAMGVDSESAVAAGASLAGGQVEMTPPPPTPARLYSQPRFSLLQDAARLHVQLREPNIEADSVRVERAGRALTVTATSVGAGLTPLYYRLELQLPAELAQPTVSYRSDDVTVTAEKAPGDWSACLVGGDDAALAEQLIPWQPEPPAAAVTPADCSAGTDEPPAPAATDAAAAAGRPSRPSASASSLCSVTSFDGPLSVSSQSSVDESLQKKGILKKRHCSESSADELLSPSSSSFATGSLSTYDEADEVRLKKSVSFSNHVLEKRYRTTSTILHDVHRAERQRAKKKRQRAARRHSDGDTSENDEFRAQEADSASVDPPRPQPVARRNSSDGDTSENDEFQSAATDGSSGGGPAAKSRAAKKRKNKRKQERKQKDQLNNELMFDLDM